MAKKKTAEEWLTEGNGKLAVGNLDGAIESYNKAIKLKPDYAEAYNNRGTAWEGKKEYDKALKDYDKAIELEPNYAVAYYNRGNTWGEKGEYDKALKDLNKAIELDPNYADAYSGRGVAWRNKKEYDKALEDFNKAIELNPNFAEAYNNRGNVWREKNEYDKAIKDYNKAIDLKPNYVIAIHNRGVAIALQAAEGLQEQFKVDVDDLEKRAEEEKKKAEKAQKHFNWLLVVFGIICAIFTIFIMVRLPTLSSNIYFPIAVASAFGIISFPFIWGLKQLKAIEARHTILSETFESLAFIEPRINFFGGQDSDWQKAMYEIYITHRIKEGPEKLLLDLYRQKSDRPPATTPPAMFDKIINKKD